MNVLKQKLEVLKEGTDDVMELLGEDSMDLIRGGAECQMDYSANYCGCGYVGPAIPSKPPTTVAPVTPTTPTPEGSTVAPASFI